MLQQGPAQTTAKSPSQPTKMLLLPRCIVAQVTIFLIIEAGSHM